MQAQIVVAYIPPEIRLPDPDAEKYERSSRNLLFYATDAAPISPQKAIEPSA
ncbi:hypothetical protein RHECNPAF_301002 [Rhizobium etli CNPAF512]|nr:hypothetical protein RHECNPAF_301002 [Rhizobium etli CNPAF512]